jgi:hypothetical protein
VHLAQFELGFRWGSNKEPLFCSAAPKSCQVLAPLEISRTSTPSTTSSWKSHFLLIRPNLL